jgi:hypothetical protein
MVARMTLLVTAGALVAACATAPGATPITQDEAVALGLAQDPLFGGLQPRDPELIGQTAWYEVTEADDGWQVVVRIGWGDCPAGCISEHQWTYAVSSTGAVDLVGESGDDLPATTVRGVVSAGPTCPVLTDPPDPMCADRPVDGAVLVLSTLDGTELERITSAPDGTFLLSLPPGAYRLEPQPVEGLMGTAEPISFSVEVRGPTLELTVAYDTGIR